jgi:hypothetical protein
MKEKAKPRQVKQKQKSALVQDIDSETGDFGKFGRVSCLKDEEGGMRMRRGRYIIRLVWENEMGEKKKKKKKAKMEKKEKKGREGREEEEEGIFFSLFLSFFIKKKWYTPFH